MGCLLLMILGRNRTALHIAILHWKYRGIGYSSWGLLSQIVRFTWPTGVLSAPGGPHIGPMKSGLSFSYSLHHAAQKLGFGDHFNNAKVILLEMWIWWMFYFDLIKLISKLSLRNFAHVWTAMLAATPCMKLCIDPMNQNLNITKI